MLGANQRRATEDDRQREGGHVEAEDEEIYRGGYQKKVWKAAMSLGYPF